MGVILFTPWSDPKLKKAEDERRKKIIEAHMANKRRNLIFRTIYITLIVLSCMMLYDHHTGSNTTGGLTKWTERTVQELFR